MSKPVLTAWLLVVAIGCFSSHANDDASADTDGRTAPGAGADGGTEPDADAEAADEDDGDRDGLPGCSGVGTFDIPAGSDGCTSEWIHGERMCPDRTICGRAVTCVAYSDWTGGSCDCPEALEDSSCQLTVADPAPSSVFTPDDDEDPSRPGIQISLTVQLECCMGHCAGVRAVVARVDLPTSPTELVLDGGRVTGPSTSARTPAASISVRSRPVRTAVGHRAPRRRLTRPTTRTAAARRRGGCLTGNPSRRRGNRSRRRRRSRRRPPDASASASADVSASAHRRRRPHPRRDRIPVAVASASVRRGARCAEGA